ncbi:MAG: glycosyltransferase family 39 protein [Planctomycetota bacterium]
MKNRLTVAVLLVLAVAAWFRLHDLGRWSIDSDEFFSLVDVQDLLDGEWPEAVQSHPLGYLAMALMARLFGETEWALRIFPALTGLAAVFCLLTMRRDVIARPAALVAGTLAAISPWLIYHSQEARFYGPLLLFATLATLWAMPGEGRRPWSASVCFVAACLCHPSAVLLVPGLVYPSLRRLLTPKRLVLLLVVIGGGAWLWMTVGEGAIRDVLVRALTLRPTARYDAVHFVAGLGYNLGVGAGLLVLCGLLEAVRRRQGGDWQLIVCAVLPPVLLLGTSMLGASTQQRYAMAAIPAALLLAGAGWCSLQGRRLLLVPVSALALLAPVPELYAYTLNGDRHDMRGMAEWLAAHTSPEDILVADEHSAIEIYLWDEPGFEDVSAWEAPLSERNMFQFLRNRREVWVVLKANRMGGVYGADFMEWLDEHFVEQDVIGIEPPFLVRHDNRLIVWKRKARINDGQGLPAVPEPGR